MQPEIERKFKWREEFKFQYFVPKAGDNQNFGESL